MSFNRFILDLNQTVTGTGVPHENAYLIFYQTDMVTQQTTYANYLCTVPSTTVSIMYNSTLVNAVQADADGIFPTIFLPDDTEYYYVLLDEDLNTIKTENHISIPPVSTLISNQFIIFDGNTYVGRNSIEIVGTTYNVDTATSWGNIITFNNPNPVAVAIAAPSPSAFPEGWVSTFQNIGNGTVTITGGANINGAATLILGANEGATISSDGSILNADRGATSTIRTTTGGTLTIATGTVTVGAASQYLIDTEAAVASDDLDTINGLYDGKEIILRTVADARDVVIKHNTGNIYNPALQDIILGKTQDIIVLRYDSSLTKLVVIAYQNSSTKTPIFTTPVFESAAITPVGGTNVYANVAHGLAGIPKFIIVVLKCISAEQGFAVGDEYPVLGFTSAVGSTTYAMDATNIQLIQTTNPCATNRTTGASFVVTVAKWEYRIRAFI